MKNALKDSEIELVVNTWLMMSIHGRTPGGLPNDLLTVGAPALLIFDRIVVDESAFAAEMAMEDQWLSSQIFRRLHAEDVIVDEDLRTRAPAGIVPQEVVSSVLSRMEREREAIKHGKPVVSLLSEVTDLNAMLLSAVGRDPQAVLYDWQEHHFRLALSGEVHQGEVAASLRVLAPNFELVPAVKGTAKELLNKVVSEERPMLYRWIYGDPNVDIHEYHAFRRSKAFREIDHLIDREREYRAFGNLDRLLRIREKTIDIREAVGATIAAVKAGRKTASEVEAELNRQCAAIIEFVETPTERRLRRRSSFWKAVVDILGLIPGVSLASQAVKALDVVGMLESDQVLERMKESRKLNPLAWFHRESRASR